MASNDPFADPSIHHASAAGAPPLDEYNPFADDNQRAALSNTARGASNPLPQPTYGTATGATFDAPPAYAYQPGAQQQSGGQMPAGHADLLRRQEELDRKAAEIERREEDLRRQNVAQGGQIKNWPPLPAWFPLKPCFYQDIAVEIPQQFQNLVKQIYYLWSLYVFTLFVNLIGSLCYLAAGGSGEQFGLAILQVALFTPCSFLLWFRPLYKAFRNDSSFNFMVFFFVLAAQICFTALQAIGFSGIGTCGFINAISFFDSNKGIAAFMTVIAGLWTVICGLDVFYLIRVHRIYRGTGASFAKAQQEFATGIASNDAVQQAAMGAAAAGVRSQFGGAAGAPAGGGGGRF